MDPECNSAVHHKYSHYDARDEENREIDEDQRRLWAESMLVYCNPLDDDIIE